MADAVCYLTEHGRDDALATHRHASAYASLVLHGDYLEASLDGPVRCTPGTLLLHPIFHAHGNRFGRCGARVINLPLPDRLAPATLRVLRVASPHDARALFECDAPNLADLIAVSTTHDDVEVLPDWQSAFVRALEDSSESIATIARQFGVSAAHASRALTTSHGMSPQLLRRELRWRRAWTMLHHDQALSDIALAAGFSDQSHFNRIARACTGDTPAALRRQIKCVQDAPPACVAHSG